MYEIDNVLFDKNYYIVPEPGAEKPYELSRQSLLSKKEVAIAKNVLDTNEDFIVLYPTIECIIAKILFYQEEIQEMPKSQAKIELSNQELNIAKTLIESMTQKFDISAYHDVYQEKLRDAIITKINGNEIVAAEPDTPNNIINLMETLQKSVEIAKRNNNKGIA